VIASQQAAFRGGFLFRQTSFGAGG
jgi:hypothetical protein